MGVSFKALLIVGYEILAETEDTQVTRFDEVTGAPYQKTISVKRWRRRINREPVDSKLVEAWVYEEAPGLRVFFPGDELGNWAIIGLLVEEASEYNHLSAAVINQADMQLRFAEVEQYASAHLNFSGMPQVYLMLDVS